jgi:hypothetical protein
MGQQRLSWPTVLAFALLAVHAGLLAWCGYRNSPTFDEVGHLPGGMVIWKYGRFDLYRVNPPLVRAVAAIPVLLSAPEFDWSNYTDAPGARPEWGIGSDFIDANGARAFWMFTLARWACIPFSVLGAVVCWRWARELYGALAGLVALTLWCLSPNILGNACMITPDAAAAACGVLAAYACWRWLDRSTWLSAILAGVALGVAELSKMTWIILFGLWPILWLVQRLPVTCAASETPAELARPKRPAPFRQLVVVLLLGLYVLNLGYAFDGTGQPLGEYRFFSASLAGGPSRNRNSPDTGNRFAGTALGAVPVPLPRDYVTGLDLQKHDFEQGKSSYLRGEFKQGGWWYYYLYAAVVKLTPGVWVLLGMAGVRTCLRRKSGGWLGALVLLTPAVAVFVLVSSQTGFNRYFRYVLPALPFLFIWAGQTAALFGRGRERSAAPGSSAEDRSAKAMPGASRSRGLLATSALVWSVCSSLACYPHSMSYFSEPAGGPRRGHEHLIDGNLDWGQDLFYLKAWIDRHPAARPLTVAYKGFFDPRAAGVDFPETPAARRRHDLKGDKNDGVGQMPSGWHAVSMQNLVSELHDYDALMRQEPAAFAGYSIRIFHVRVDDVVGDPPATSSSMDR